MSALADEVLPLIRTRADLHRWSAANAHGARMHAGVTILRDAALTQDAGIVLDVTQRAIASALKVIMRAGALPRTAHDHTEPAEQQLVDRAEVHDLTSGRV